jgi:PEP-CTERM motif
MRKLSLIFFVFTLVVTLGSMTTSAQTGIALSTSSTSGISFTSTGGGNLSMGAAVFGSAAGLGSLLGDTGFYSLMSGAPIALTLGPSFSPIFADYTASGTLNFDITTAPGGGGTTLLQGTLTLVDLVQAFSTGMTNTSAVLNLSVNGGSLASFSSGNTGIGQLTINLSGLGFLPSLGSGSAKLSGATLDALPTPEPQSMLLFGTGLLLFGIVLRRRLANTNVAIGV